MIMEAPFITDYWEKRLDRCRKALEKNGFEAYVVPDVRSAGETAWELIRAAAPASVAYGDSMTLRATGLLPRVAACSDWTFIDGFDPALSRPEKMARRRQALGADLFMTGCNAVTDTGRLFWLDMIGNRIAPVCFGPLDVVLFVGRNKLVADDEEARRRIRETAAPMNAIRHTGMKTPCMTTARCHDCASDDRICNAWLVLEKSFPKRRIKVLLINEDLGL